MENAELIKKAKEVMKNAYAPYSGFKVGAAVLCGSGKVYTGCNVENASFGATNCAERTAVFNAVSKGESELLKIAVVSSSGKQTNPCGICLQVLSELMPSGSIVLSGKDGILEFPVSDFLPRTFGSKDF